VVETYGLTHVALAVKDPKRSAAFYQRVFDCVVVYEDDGKVELQTPARRDVIALERSSTRIGESGGLRHFGFRLVRAGDIEAAVEAVLEAGGCVDRRGEFAPGYPYAFVRDLDGYEVEIWFE
jgi:catechol 2,3-dioxygenase-like lactoylglutathione lyase family enzyme